MTIVAELSFYLSVHDTIELWHAAAKRAVKDGIFDTMDAYRAEHDEDDISTHLRMLMDNGTPPDCGFEIEDSVCEVGEHL